MRRTGYASDNGIFYILRDHLGSTSVILEQNGTVSKREFYYPFGGNRGSAFSNSTTKRFTGQYHEKDLPGGEGLSFYNARWYDAQLGRFVSADTIVPEPGNPQAFNRFAYTINNPLKFIDSTGHAYEASAGTGGSRCDWWCYAQGNSVTQIVHRAADDRRREASRKNMINVVKDYYIPTAFSREGGVKVGFDYFGGIELAVEYQVAINWFSGDISLFENISGGVYAGTPRGFLLEGTESYSAIWNASNPGVIAGPFSYAAGEVGLDYFARATADGTLSMSVDYHDIDGDGQFDQNETIYFLSPVMDPEFNKPIIAGSGGIHLGGNAIPNVIEWGIHGGVGATYEDRSFNIYDVLPRFITPPWHRVD